MKMVRFFICLLVVLLSGCNIFGDTDSSASPAPLVNFEPTVKVQRLWAAQAGDGVGSDYLKLGPVVVGNQIFTADTNGHVIATNAITGEKIWQIDTKHAITSGPSVGENIIVVGTVDAEVLAFKMNGAPLWHTKVSDQVLATPQIGNGKVIVKTVDGKIVALATHNGELQWSYHHGSPTLVMRSSSTPEIVGNTVLAGFADGKLAAVSLSQGQLLWEQVVAVSEGVSQVEQMVDIVADPHFTNGVVFIVTYQGKVSAVTLQTGQALWQQKTAAFSGLALNSQMIVITDREGTVWAFNRASGKLLWKQTQLSNRKLTEPAFIGDTIVVGDHQGYLHWLAQNDGRLVARAHVAKKVRIIAPPVVVGSTVFVITEEGKLTAWRAG